MYLEWTAGVYESGPGHLPADFRSVDPPYQGQVRRCQLHSREMIRACPLCDACPGGRNYPMGFSKGNFCSHFPRECLMLGKRRTDSAQHFLTTAALHSTASPAPCLPPSSRLLQLRDTEYLHFSKSFIFFQEFTWLQSLIFPEQGKRSLQSSSKKMIASASGFQQDVLLQLFTNWLYLKLPWGAGAGRKDASEKTLVGMSEELLRPPKGTSCLNTSNP